MRAHQAGASVQLRALQSGFSASTQIFRWNCCSRSLGQVTLQQRHSQAMTAVQPWLHCGRSSFLRGLQAHYEIWKYCQSTSKVQAQLPQNLRVRHIKLQGSDLMLEIVQASLDLASAGVDGGCQESSEVDFAAFARGPITDSLGLQRGTNHGVHKPIRG